MTYGSIIFGTEKSICSYLGGVATNPIGEISTTYNWNRSIRKLWELAHRLKKNRVIFKFINTSFVKALVCCWTMPYFSNSPCDPSMNSILKKQQTERIYTSVKHLSKFLKNPNFTLIATLLQSEQGIRSQYHCMSSFRLVLW